MNCLLVTRLPEGSLQVIGLGMKQPVTIPAEKVREIYEEGRRLGELT